MEKDSKGVTVEVSGKEDLQDLGFFKFIIASLPVGVLAVNPRMRITSFNPWAEMLTGRALWGKPAD